MRPRAPSAERGGFGGGEDLFVGADRQGGDFVEAMLGTDGGALLVVQLRPVCVGSQTGGLFLLDALVLLLRGGEGIPQRLRHGLHQRGDGVGILEQAALLGEGLHGGRCGGALGEGRGAGHQTLQRSPGSLALGDGGGGGLPLLHRRDEGVGFVGEGDELLVPHARCELLDRRHRRCGWGRGIAAGTLPGFTQGLQRGRDRGGFFALLEWQAEFLKQLAELDAVVGSRRRRLLAQLGLGDLAALHFGEAHLLAADAGGDNPGAFEDVDGAVDGVLGPSARGAAEFVVDLASFCAGLDGREHGAANGMLGGIALVADGLQRGAVALLGAADHGLPARVVALLEVGEETRECGGDGLILNGLTQG